MTSSLDMSLADIIKTQKTSRPRNSKAKSTGPAKTTGSAKTAGPARTAGTARNRRSTRAKKPYQAGAQQYKATPVAPLHTSVIRRNAPDGSKIQVSNLDHRVTSDDLKVTFT